MDIASGDIQRLELANQVRGCEDKNGYVAKKTLYDRFNLKIPVSLTGALRDVTRPKDIREAGRAIDA